MIYKITVEIQPREGISFSENMDYALAKISVLKKEVETVTPDLEIITTIDQS